MVLIDYFNWSKRNLQMYNFSLTIRVNECLTFKLLSFLCHNYVQRPVNHLFDWDCVPGERGGNESLYLCNSFTRSTIHCGWIIYNLTISLFLSFFSEASWWVKPWQLGCCHDRYDSIIMWWSVIRSYHWCSFDHCVMWKDLLYIYIFTTRAFVVSEERAGSVTTVISLTLRGEPVLRQQLTLATLLTRHKAFCLIFVFNCLYWQNYTFIKIFK